MVLLLLSPHSDGRGRYLAARPLLFCFFLGGKRLGGCRGPRMTRLPDQLGVGRTGGTWTTGPVAAVTRFGQ